MHEFGQRVRFYRKQQKMSREAFCQDEERLSVRQLTRIESGKSNPNLDKIQFIAERLDLPIGVLTDGYSLELPARYKELKFLILRTPSYQDKQKIALKQSYFKEIFDNFYDYLPEEEQMVIEILQSKLDLIKDNHYFAAEKIIQDYFKQVKLKSNYTINDLVLIDLYLTYVYARDYDQDVFDEQTYHQIISTLYLQVDSLPAKELFVLVKVLISLFGNSLTRNCFENMKQSLDTIERAIYCSQDFQQLPIFCLLKWKYHLKKQQPNVAKFFYNRAMIFCNITQDHYLQEKLEAEWRRDNKK